jgi:hypothetical protein
VAQAVAQLPAEAQQNGVQVRKRATNLMMGVSLYSPDNTHSPLFVSNYASTQVREALARCRASGRCRCSARATTACASGCAGPHERAERHHRRYCQALREQNVQGAAGRWARRRSLTASSRR